MADYFLTTMITIFVLASNTSEGAPVLREIESSVDQNHCTTRQFQHKTFYPNVNQDVREGLCVMYSRSVDEDDPGQPRAVMVSVVPSPQEPLSGVTDVLVDGENCRGAHVTTRPHNRKVLYHAPSDNWFVFHGTGHWIDKLGDAGLEREMIAWRSSRDGKTFTALSPAVTGNGHSNSADVLLVGDRIYLSHARFGHWRHKAGIPALVDGNPIWHRERIDPEKPNFYSPYEIFSFDIAGGQLRDLPQRNAKQEN